MSKVVPFIDIWRDTRTRYAEEISNVYQDETGEHFKTFSEIGSRYDTLYQNISDLYILSMSPNMFDPDHKDCLFKGWSCYSRNNDLVSFYNGESNIFIRIGYGSINIEIDIDGDFTLSSSTVNYFIIDCMNDNVGLVWNEYAMKCLGIEGEIINVKH